MGDFSSSPSSSSSVPRSSSSLALCWALLLSLLCGSALVSAAAATYGQTLSTFSGGSSALWWPWNLALDSTNSVYVTDLLVSDNYYIGRARVIKYSSGGAVQTPDLNSALLNTFALETDEYYSQESLIYIATDASDRLYVNNGTQMVRLFKNAQALLYAYPPLYTDIAGVTVDKSTGYLYVFSFAEQTMYVQSSSGALVSSYPTNFSAYGYPAPPNLSQLTALGSTGVLLAIDTTNSVAFWLSLNGSVLHAYTDGATGFMTCGAVDAANNALVIVTDSDPSGSGNGINWRIVSFAYPTYTARTTYTIPQVYAYFVSMAVGSDRLVYLLDYEFARVTVFNPATGAITSQIRGGWTPSYFSTDSAGNVYMSDRHMQCPHFLPRPMLASSFPSSSLCCCRQLRLQLWRPPHAQQRRIDQQMSGNQREHPQHSTAQHTPHAHAPRQLPTYPRPQHSSTTADHTPLRFYLTRTTPSFVRVAGFAMAGALADGNSMCVWSQVNSAGTLLATANGNAALTVNGSVDGNSILIFNTQSGKLSSTVAVSSNAPSSFTAMAIDNAGSLYYAFLHNSSAVHVRTGTGGFVRDIPTRGGLTLYTFNIDVNSQLHLFYFNGSHLVWDRAALNGSVLQTRTVPMLRTAGVYEDINGPRVDHAGALYYMVRIVGPGGQVGNGTELQVRVMQPDGSILLFWTDQVLLDNPYTLAVDGSGAVYTDDPTQHSIIKWVGVNYVGSPASSGAVAAATVTLALWLQVGLACAITLTWMG